MDKPNDEAKPPQTTVAGATAIEEIAEMPPVPAASAPSEPVAVDPKPPKGVKVPGNAKGKRDANGLSFDPDIHEVEDDGSARLNRDGTLRIKRGNNFKAKDKSQRVAEATPVAPVGPALSGDPEQLPPNEGAVDTQRGARAAAMVQLFESLGVTAFGEEWRLKDSEKFELTTSVDAVMAEYVAVAVPTPVLLIGTLAAIAVPRFMKEGSETRKRVGTYWTLFRQRVTGGRPSSPEVGSPVLHGPGSPLGPAVGSASPAP